MVVLLRRLTSAYTPHDGMATQWVVFMDTNKNS
jgi:hypothetical protein